MKLERTNNAIINISFGIINKVVVLIVPFIIRTIIIINLGAEYLGLSSLFTSILQVLSFAELGFGTAMVYHMYAAIATDDNEKIGALLEYYKKIYRVIGLTILGIGLICMPFLQYLIEGDCPSDVNIYILYLIFLGNTVISYFLYAYKKSLLNAYQKTSVMSNINTVIILIKSICEVFLLIVFKNYYMYIIILPLSTAADNLLTAVLTKKMYPYIIQTGMIGADTRADIRTKIKGLMCHRIGSTVVNSIDSIVISMFLGLIALAKYQNYYLIMMGVAGVLGIVYTSITAAVGNSLNIDSSEKNYYDFKKFTFMNFWIVCVCSSCLLCLYQPFIQIWLGEEFLYDNYMVVLFVIYFYVYQSRKIVITYKDAAGLWNEDKIRPFIESALNLGINIILITRIGIAGVLISTIVSMFFVNVFWESYIVYKNVFEKSILNYVKDYLGYTIISVLALGGAYFSCSFISNFGMISLLIKGILCLATTNIVLIIVYFRNAYFKEALRLIKIILNTIKIKKKFIQ